MKALVLSVDTEREKISLGLKPSYFQDVSCFHYRSLSHPYRYGHDQQDDVEFDESDGSGSESESEGDNDDGENNSIMGDGSDDEEPAPASSLVEANYLTPGACIQTATHSISWN